MELIGSAVDDTYRFELEVYDVGTIPLSIDVDTIVAHHDSKDGWALTHPANAKLPPTLNDFLKGYCEEYLDLKSYANPSTRKHYFAVKMKDIKLTS